MSESRNGAESKESFFAIYDWMREELNLRMNELLVFARIHNFTMYGKNHKFEGSRRYLAEQCGCTMQTVDAATKKLLEKGLIQKEEYWQNKQKFVNYWTTYTPQENAQGIKKTDSPRQKTIQEDGQESLQGYQENMHGGIKKTDTNIYREYKSDINNMQKEKGKNDSLAVNVVQYLNKQAGTTYDINSPVYAAVIECRAEQGYGVEDFKRIIDNKCADWKGTKFEGNLRPSVLFGEKHFDEYLNQARPIEAKQRLSDLDDILKDSTEPVNTPYGLVF